MQGFPANYWRLLGSSAASNLADGVFFIVLPLLAVRLTDSPILIAGLAIAGRLPWLFFVLVAGALADRLDRRVTMRNVQLFRVVVLAGLTALAVVDGLSLPILYAVALGLGIAAIQAGDEGIQDRARLVNCPLPAPGPGPAPVCDSTTARTVTPTSQRNERREGPLTPPPPPAPGRPGRSSRPSRSVRGAVRPPLRAAHGAARGRPATARHRAVPTRPVPAAPRR